MTTVLYFPRPGEKAGSMASFSSRCWNIQTADSNITASQVRKFIDFWKPAGCIVNNDRLPATLFRGIPTVFAHRDPKSLPPLSALISFDEQAIANLAAHELLRLNLKTYGFVPWPKAEYWSQKRESCFQKALEINFKEMARFDPFAKHRSTTTFPSALAEWISALPKPAGLFAANDNVARLVINVCAQIGLSVPNDVSVIGVDNIDHLCENQSISITSIATDDTALSQKCSHALAQKLQHRRQATTTYLIKPLNVVRRASTFRLDKRDACVSEAVELIRRQACSGLTAHDVLKLFPCCRRMAERRFRMATGHSILAEITSVRLALAQRLLAEGSFKTDAIANACGYASWSSVHRLLKV